MSTAEKFVRAITDDHEPTSDRWTGTDPVAAMGDRDPENDHGDSLFRDPEVFGYGFSIITAATTRYTIPSCRYCGTALFVPARSWWCEFDDHVTARPKIGPGKVCKCNACIWNECVFREGRPPEFCDDPECKRRRGREQRAAERERQNARARDTATHWLTEDPSRSDREIAVLAGVLPVRVTEARRTLVAA